MKTNSPANTSLLNTPIKTLEKKCEICSNLTIKTREWRHWRPSGVFIVNFEHISHLFLAVSRVAVLFRTFWVFSTSGALLFWTGSFWGINHFYNIFLVTQCNLALNYIYVQSIVRNVLNKQIKKHLIRFR